MCILQSSLRADWRMVDGRVDGWLDRPVLGWMGVDRGMALEAGGPIRRWL